MLPMRINVIANGNERADVESGHGSSLLVGPFSEIG